MAFQPFCRIRNFPGPVKLLLGMAFVLIGVPVFLLPIPLGFLFIIAGAVLILSALRKEAAMSAYLNRRFPRLIRRWEAISATCAPGSQGKNQDRDKSVPPDGIGDRHPRAASRNTPPSKTDNEPR